MNKLADSIAEQFIVAFRGQLEPQLEVVKKGFWARLLGFLRGRFGRSSKTHA